MSGIVGSKLNIRGSSRIAKLGTDGQVLTSAGAGVSVVYEDIAAGISWQTIVTASTMTAVAGEGYWINTSSNTCTITLPSSASVGDTIIFADYARNWGTNGIIIDSNGLKYQGDDDTYDVEYGTDGLALRIVYMNSTKGWIPTIDEAVADVPSKGNDEGIFGYGWVAAGENMTNLVSNTGVVSSDVTGVGTDRAYLAACEYGGDKGIFAYGTGPTSSSALVSMSNLVSNAGVVATDVTGVGTARYSPAACGFGGDKGIFAYGGTNVGGFKSMSNLVSNAGVVATDVTGVGTARDNMAACEYGTGLAIFAYGYTGSVQNMSNLVTNVGVIGSDVTGVGTARRLLGGCAYGYDKGIFGFGYTSSAVSLTNLVTNVGVIGDDVTGVGTATYYVAACEYGGDKGIVAYGADAGGYSSISHLISNAGVVATDVTGVGTARQGPAACSFN